VAYELHGDLANSSIALPSLYVHIQRSAEFPGLYKIFISFHPEYIDSIFLNVYNKLQCFVSRLEHLDGGTLRSKFSET